MRKLIIICTILLAFCFQFLPNLSYSQENSDKTQFVSLQMNLLKNRLTQSQMQLITLEKEEQKGYSDLAFTQSGKNILDELSLDVATAKSNVDSVSIELTDSLQTITRLENEIQEINSQLNLINIFGLKTPHAAALDINHLNDELTLQKNLLALEKTRSAYLTKLQKVTDNIWQLQKNKFDKISIILKTQSVMHLQALQSTNENSYDEEQSVWLKKINALYAQLNEEEVLKQNPQKITELKAQITYANENLNYSYLQMLTTRYKSQLEQLKSAIANSVSITSLNKTSEQLKILTKQTLKISDLLKTREKILQQYQSSARMTDNVGLEKLKENYQSAITSVTLLNGQLNEFRLTLDKALQYELATRQGLPGLDIKAWLALGAEMWLLPTLAYQVIKNLGMNVAQAFAGISYFAILMIAFLEIFALLFFNLANQFLEKVVSGMAEHELGHINLKRLSILLVKRNLPEIFLIGNIVSLFYFCKLPQQSSSLIINLMLVWLFFKVVISAARICLVETVHHRAGHDVRLYHRLKWSFIVGGCITAVTVFMHQLPVMYEVKDLFDRLFLLFLLVVSGFLLKSWEVFPSLILAHVDERRSYLRNIIRLVGLILPAILLINSAIGLFGYVNFVLTISWYESVFVMVLIGYLVVRGVCIDLMTYASTLLIRHVSNGWLWTEAFLKPLDKVVRVALFLLAWAALFLFYGWNQQSPVIEQVNAMFHYPLLDILNTTITPVNILELVAVVSFLFWAARWTREFTFRLLSSRTTDMGLRNSLAIFSQYATIIVGIFICLRVLGIDLKALTFVATGLAFGVGLGLRDLANNFACGFLLLIERPLRVGDIVSINDHEGEVTHIGGRAVTIRTWDHMEVLVPNAEIFSKSFVNWTAKDQVVRSVATIKINRHDNPHAVQALIYQVLSEHPQVLTDPNPEVYLKEMSDAFIEFEVRYFLNLRQVRSRLGLRSEVLVAIWEAFERHDIQPPYPHHAVHLKNSLSHSDFLVKNITSVQES